jgi:4-hydroxy-3-polyprenylbenzoate decarboxylase
MQAQDTARAAHLKQIGGCLVIHLFILQHKTMNKDQMGDRKKIVVAVTGASGSIYAKRLLTQLAQRDDVEVGVVMSRNAGTVWRQELGEEPALPFQIYGRDDFFAPFASGSARYTHMVIAPCSMGTLGRIAHGISDDLITRAADVILKERRQLICIVRDTPLSLIHLENMTTVTRAGGIIMPASPSFYSRPADFDALADTVVHRAMDMMGLDVNAYRWGAD